MENFDFFELTDIYCSYLRKFYFKSDFKKAEFLSITSQHPKIFNSKIKFGDMHVYMRLTNEHGIVETHICHSSYFKIYDKYGNEVSDLDIDGYKLFIREQKINSLVNNL